MKYSRSSLVNYGCLVSNQQNRDAYDRNSKPLDHWLGNQLHHMTVTLWIFNPRPLRVCCIGERLQELLVFLNPRDKFPLIWCTKLIASGEILSSNASIVLRKVFVEEQLNVSFQLFMLLSNLHFFWLTCNKVSCKHRLTQNCKFRSYNTLHALSLFIFTYLFLLNILKTPLKTTKLQSKVYP